MDAKTRSRVCLILFLLPFTARGQEATSFYHVSYFENKNGVRRELAARVDHGKILIDRRRGDFLSNLMNSPPWFLQGLSLVDETVRLQGSGLPPLDFQKNIDWEVLGNIKRGKVKLILEVEEALLPLNSSDTALNELLQKEEMQKISLKGEGEVWMKANSGEVIGEKLFISGDVVRKNQKELWRMEWAKCLSY